MKIPLLVLFFALCPTLYSDPIDASELARHLGVYTIRIPSADLPAFYYPRIIEAIDGALKPLPRPEYLGVGFKNHGDLVICIRETEKCYVVSLDNKGMAVRVDVPLLNKNAYIYFAQSPLRKNTSEPFILCAEKNPNLHTVDPKSIKDMSRGYV